MGEQENGNAVERFWRALEDADFEAAKAELHSDFVEFFPQSGERIRGCGTGFPSSPTTRGSRRLRSTGLSVATTYGLTRQPSTTRKTAAPHIASARSRSVGTAK